MDKIKIGKFIYELRKENKLTQAEFAARLHVTAQAVSKWENGRGIPDIAILQAISQEFKVDISSILDGEKKEITQMKKKKNVVLYIIGLVIVLLFGSYMLFKDEFQTYFVFSSLVSSNESFEIKGVAAYSKAQKSIYISRITYKDKEDKNELFKAIECGLYEVHGNKETRLSIYGNIDEIKFDNGQPLSEILSEVEFTVENFEDDCDQIKDNQLYVSIDLKRMNDEVITYKIPLTLQEACEK